MKTEFEVTFKLDALDFDSGRALLRIDEVKNHGEEICNRLAEKGLEALTPLIWVDGFPPEDDQMKTYDEMTLERLVPIMLKQVAKKIEPVLDDSPNSLAENFQNNLDDSNDSEMAIALKEIILPRFELRYTPDACVVFDGVHYTTTKVFTTVPSQQYTYVIPHQGQEFRYWLTCEIESKLGE